MPQLQKCQIVTKVPLSGYISAPLLQKFPMNVTKVPYQCYESSLFSRQKCPFLLLSLSLSLSLSLYVTQRRRERVPSHIPYHHGREVKIFAWKNFSQQITVKTLKNSLWVVFKTLTLCSYNLSQGAGFESCSVAFLFSFCLSLFCFVFVFVLFAYLFCCCCLLNIYLLQQR